MFKKLNKLAIVQILVAVSVIFYSITENTYAMHIMEGYLPKKWSAIWTIVFIPFLIYGLKSISKILKNNPEKKVLLALCGAFVFILSALKIPSVSGSCSHPTGVGLGAIMFGPSVMVVLGTIVLLFQAILLAHGGITTLGANAFSMAIVGPIVSWILFKALGKTKLNKGIVVFIAAALGDLATYLVTSTQLALAFPDPSGGVILSLVKFMGVFMVTQVPIAAAEGILTVIIYNLITDRESKGVKAHV